MEISTETGSIILHGQTRCLNRCTFCPGTVKDGLSTEERFQKFLKDSQYFIDNKFKNIEISGNDPIQFPKIIEAIRHLKENGIQYLTLSTHGRNFKNSQFTAEARKAGLDFCRIPIYGSTEIIHNKSVQYVSQDDEENLSVGNAFQDTIEGIKNCVRNDIRIYGHTVPMQHNKLDLANIIDLYLELTAGKMNNMTISPAFISAVDTTYTAQWYLPQKDIGNALRKVLNHRIQKDFPHIKFKIVDFPYCVVHAISPLIENTNLVPNLGVHKLIQEIQSDLDDSIPHYRLKSYLDGCKECIALKACGGYLINDKKMFGTDGIRPITADALMDPDFLNFDK